MPSYVLPGDQWPSDLLDPHGSGEFVLDWIADVSPDPATQAHTAQVREEFRRLFPDVDPVSFVAGIATLYLWWLDLSTAARNAALRAGADNCPDCMIPHEVDIPLDTADEFMSLHVMRLSTILFGLVEDDEQDDVDEIFLDITEPS